MSTPTSNMQFAEKDGVTFSLASLTASAVQTFWPNLTVLVSVAQVVPVTGGNTPSGVTVTIGSSTGRAPNVPSSTVGFNIPPNTVQPIYLGANHDSLRFFNLDSTNSANVSIVGMAV